MHDCLFVCLLAAIVSSIEMEMIVCGRLLIEQFSYDRHKTKIKVITSGQSQRAKYRNEPIRDLNKTLQPVESAGKVPFISYWLDQRPDCTSILNQSDSSANA